MPKKVNPRRIPATQADVEKAWDHGVMTGIRHADVIFLSVLVDKHEHELDIMQVWDEIGKLAGEIAEGRVSMADLRNVLREEYNINL
jgi:hypothetical protein